MAEPGLHSPRACPESFTKILAVYAMAAAQLLFDDDDAL